MKIRGHIAAVLLLFISGSALANQLQVTVTEGGAVNGASASVTIANCRATSGTCSGTTPQTVSETITLTATPDANQVFTGWGGECAQVGTNPTCTLVIQAHFDDVSIPVQAVSAGFATLLRGVNVTVQGDGTVTGGEISCPENCSSQEPQGSTITLLATPNSGSVFLNWAGTACNGSTATTCSAVVDEEESITAVFGLPPDEDSDGVQDALDQCPATPEPELSFVDQNGCSPSQLDEDNDGVSNGVDQCPGTPPGALVNELGCAIPVVNPPDVDSDSDGVFDTADQCPDTPAGESVDVEGCSDSQKDDDNDGVNNALDQCPDTPAGDQVDAEGCSLPGDQDDDGDGVSNVQDQCPNTPAGVAVDERGCSDSQNDEDQDGVDNTLDQCPDTAAGDDVDASGCSESQKDDDDDGVSNDLDQCPDTPAGEEVDEEGCSLPQDDDGDGVENETDQCPATPADTPVNDVGCSVEQNFGNELGALPGLSGNQRSVASRIDEVCPLLLELDRDQSLSAGQQDLLDACVNLKNRNTTTEQATAALNAITVTELAAMLDYALELSNAQHRHLGSRLREVAAGGGGGISVSGLQLRAGDQSVPGHVLQSMFDGLLGMAAGEDNFTDFGKLGLFLQGDLNVGERDQSGLNTGYEFDSWSVTFGGDYRFTDTLFGGVSVNVAEVDVEYDASRGDTQIDSWALSAYGGWQITDAWYLDGLVSYGSADYKFNRRVQYVDVGGAFDSQHRSDSEGDQVFVGLNTGYMWNPGSWRIGPIASLTWLDGTLDGFTERAAGGQSQAWNFIVDDRDYESLRLHLGFQADYIYNTSFGVLIPGVRFAWVNENEDGSERIDMRLAHNPFADSELRSDNITVFTEGRDSSFFDASVNLSGQFQMGFSGFISYQFYSGYDDFSREGFTFGLRWDKPY